MVYACTNDKDINNKIKEDCNNARILVAICDNPTESDIVMPATCVYEGVTIAVGTNGKDPKKGIKIRNKIQELIELGKIDLNSKTSKKGI